MGVMYTFSVWGTELIEGFMMHTWYWILLVALLFSLFGRKRVNCDHHMPSIWRSLRELTGVEPCHGECLQIEQYNRSMLMDDLAWSLYILDLGLWTYLFLLVLWVVTFFIWSVVLWAMVIIAFICMLIAGMCAACGVCAEGGVDCAGCNCACPEVCDCAGCFPVSTPAPGSTEFFFWGGPYPYYDLNIAPVGGNDCDCCGDCGCSCSWRCCCACCLPIAWMAFVFPRMPENAWGGLVGYFCGTHALTRPENLYQGSNRFVEFLGMSWRRGDDLRGDQEWRQQVYDFIRHGPVPNEDSEVGQARHHVSADGTRREIVSIGRNGYAILIDRPFDQVDDAIVESSFDDYEQGKCWICQIDKGHQEFDLWLGCHHIFCSRCSTEMLRRNMPCPLCRIASTAVLRGKAISG